MASAAPKPGDAQPRNFREVVQKRLMKDVIEAAADLSRGWMVMVIDDAALRVVSALVGMYDVMEHRVTLIELLSKRRQPLPEMEVIYLVTPTLDTVNGILADFADPKKPLYGNVHLFFLSKVNDILMQRLGSNPNFLARVRTFKEINMNFLATEAYAFHLDMPNTIPRLFSTRPDASALEETAYKLVSLCVTLHEYPHVRYNSHSVIASQIATLVQDSLNEFVGRTEEWWYYGQSGHTERDRGTLLVLDRAEDPLTPFMHDHTYQAIVQDLLDVKDDMITFNSENKSGRADTKALLNETDTLWTEFRHQHIAKVMETISDRTRDFIQANAGVELTRKMGGGAKMSPAELAQIVRQIPEYREMTGKLWLHYSITSDVMARFQHLGVLSMSDLEQTMATGVDEEGKAPNDTKVLQSLEALLQAPESSGMTHEGRMRLLCIYIITQNGLTDEVRRELVSVAGLNPADQETLLQLEKFGVNLQKTREARNATTSSSFWGTKKKDTRKLGRTDETAIYAASRFVCSLKDLIEQLVEDKLPVEKYPSVLPMPAKEDKPAPRSMRRNNPNSRFGRQEKQSFAGTRNIVFMVGGVTFSETRVAYEVMNEHEKEVIIGGTSYLTAKSFLSSLREMASS